MALSDNTSFIKNGPPINGIQHVKDSLLEIEDDGDTSTTGSLQSERGRVASITGGWDRLDTDSMGDITWTEGTRTFSIAPKAAQPNFHFWSNGNYYEKTSAESIIIPDVGGTYYVYYDTDGALQSVLDTEFAGDLFRTVAITALCYYNATEETIWPASDEQHGIMMDSATHLRLHLVEGAVFIQGLLISGLEDGESTYTSTALGLVADEDINLMTSLASTHSFIYRDGAAGEWRETALDNECGHVVSGDTEISWNENTSGTVWQLTEATSSTDYVIMFFVWTNLTNGHIKKIVGQQTYSSRSNARNGIKNELTAIELAGLPSSETTFLYAYICKDNGDVEDDGDGNDYVDLRKTKGYNLPD